jgi:glycine cleavage system H protein
MLKFTQDHEWLRIEGDLVTFGITEHAQEQLGDIVFVELPKVGDKITQGSAVAVVESVKAASDVYAPISGDVVEVNSAIVETPALINEDAMGKGWFARLKMTDASQVNGLMDEQSYRALIG